MSSQFMAWERSFEARIMKVRAKELKYQRLNYIIEVRLLLVSYILAITHLSPGFVVRTLVRGWLYL
jgi:hypothetical protein